MTRDYIKEIKLKYDNLHKDKKRWEQLSIRIDPLLKSINEIRKIESDDIQDELLRGCIIGIVSCIEGYIRLTIKDIIDFGEPYSSNADAISKSKKIYNFINNNQSITKGDLISHTLSINNISSIDEILSSLLGIDFWPSLQVNPALDDDDTPLSEFNPNLYDHLEELFSYRHMFAHELANDVYIEIDDVDYFLSIGLLFMYVTEEMIDTYVYGEDIKEPETILA